MVKTAKQTGHTLLEDYKIIDNSKGKIQGRSKCRPEREKDEQKEGPEENGAKKKDKWWRCYALPIPSLTDGCSFVKYANVVITQANQDFKNVFIPTNWKLFHKLYFMYSTSVEKNQYSYIWSLEI